MGAIRVSSFAACIEPARRYRLLPYYFALELHRCHATRRLVEKWWDHAAGEPEAEALVRDWLDTLAALPLRFRPPLARWLERSGGELAKPVPAPLGDVLRAAVALHSPQFVADCVAGILRELRRGCPSAFILQWLELRCEFGTYTALPKTVPDAQFPLERVRELLKGSDKYDQGRAMQDAFRACSAWPDAAACLMRPEWNALTLEERQAAMNFMEWSGESADTFLTELAAMAPEMRAAFEDKVYWRARSGLVDAGVEGTRIFLRRWRGDAAPLLELAKWLDEFPARLRPSLLHLPTDAARQLVKASRGLGGEARFSGARALVQSDADRTLAWLLTAPAHFVDTCVWLSAYGCVRARRLLSKASHAPLFARPGAESAGAGSPDHLVRLDALLTQHSAFAARLPEYATWDKHFSGVKVLKTAAIQDVARRVASHLPLLQMWWLQSEIKRDLALHPEEHATLFRATLADNRRPLTRFLREHSAGRGDARLAHPANQNWLARRPGGFQLDAWLDPPALSAGELTLGVERDPLEILKIGSYVGSCLALGGMNAHATVAILLDANKRVVFARNARGRFMARQVVAISDDGKLVCYAVYPRNTTPAIEDAFERYAEEWAARLGLPLAKGEGRYASGRVPPLTVKHWYDDGLWERFDA